MKLDRQIRALKRFKLQSEIEFNNGQKGDRNVGSYNDYLMRKNEERKALEMAIPRHLRDA